MRISDWSSDVCSSDLSAWRVKARSMRTSRNWSGARPLGRAMEFMGRSRHGGRESNVGRGYALRRLLIGSSRIPGRRGGSPDLRHIRNGPGACNGILCDRSEEHTYELQSLMRISYAVLYSNTTITQ